MINIKDAYYFPHDSNAKDDPKCILLIEQLGLEGYGIYWVLVETLRDQPGYKYPLKLLPALARRFNTTIDKMKLVVCNYGLFHIENDEFFFSQSLIERMEIYDHKRDMARIAGKKSAEKRLLLNGGSTGVQQPFNDGSTSKVKYSKVKESKEDIKEKTALEIAVDDFKTFRKQIKSPMTDRAIQLMLTKLNELASDDDTKIAILNQSIVQGWKGVFPLKKDGGGQNSNDKGTKPICRDTDQYAKVGFTL